MNELTNGFSSRFSQRLQSSITKKAGTRAKSILKPISKIQNALRGWRGIGKLIGLWLLSRNLPSAKAAMNKLRNAFSLKNITAKATQFVHSMGDMVSKTVKNAVNNLQKTITNTITTVSNQIQNTISNITTSIQNIASSVEKGFSGIATNVANDYTSAQEEYGGGSLGNALALITAGYSAIEAAKGISSTVSTSTLGVASNMSVVSGENKLIAYALSKNDNDDKNTQELKQQIINDYKSYGNKTSTLSDGTIEVEKSPTAIIMEGKEAASHVMHNRAVGIEAQVGNIMYKQDDMSKMSDIINHMKSTYAKYTEYYKDADTQEKREKKKLEDIEVTAKNAVAKALAINDKNASIEEEDIEYSQKIPLISELRLTRAKLEAARARYDSYNPPVKNIPIPPVHYKDPEGRDCLLVPPISSPITKKEKISFEEFLIQCYTVNNSKELVDDTDYDNAAEENIKGLNYTDCYLAPESTVQIVPDAIDKKKGYITYSVKELAWKCIRDHKNRRDVDPEDIEIMERRYVNALRYLKNTMYKMEIAVCQAKYDLGIARAKERIETSPSYTTT